MELPTAFRIIVVLTVFGPLKSQVFDRKVVWPLDNRLAHQKASGSNRPNMSNRSPGSQTLVVTSTHKTHISAISCFSLGMPDATLEKASQFAHDIFTCHTYSHHYRNMRTSDKETSIQIYTNIHMRTYSYIHIYIQDRHACIYSWLHLYKCTYLHIYN